VYIGKRDLVYRQKRPSIGTADPGGAQGLRPVPMPVGGKENEREREREREREVLLTIKGAFSN